MNLITRAKDASKDQTYFLWQIKQEQLPHILFPVGEYDVKADVRTYAQSNDLITSNKPDSQGLCFVGQTSLRDMLLQTLGQKDGFIYTYLTQDQVDQIGLKVTKKTRGKVNQGGQFKIQLGSHQGAFLYTIGQRQNLGISNGPWFVAEVDIENNEVIVCHNEFQEAIESKVLLIKDLNWYLDLLQNSLYTKLKTLNTKEVLELKKNLINLKFKDHSNDFGGIFRYAQDDRVCAQDDNISSQGDDFFNLSIIEKFYIIELQVKAQIRYRSPAKNCKVYVFIPKLNYALNRPDGIFRYAQDDNPLFAIVEFDEPIKAAAKGQSIAFYDYDTDQYLLGGGVIDQVIQ